MATFSVILPASGGSRRFHDKAYKKPYAPLAGRAVWLHSAERFLNRADVKQVIAVIAEEDREEFHRKFGANIAILGVDVCVGGRERADSVENALRVVSRDIDFVAVHDAARPCLIDKWIDAVFAAAKQHGAAILAAPVTGTIKRAADAGAAIIAETVDRTGLWEAQTPQVFRRDWLMEAYEKRKSAAPTDDAELVQQCGRPVHLVEASTLNIKITTKDDLRLAEQILKVLPRSKPARPAHPFADDDMWR